MAGVDGRLDQMLVAAEILGNGQLPFGVVRETLLNGGKLLGRLVCLAKRNSNVVPCSSDLAKRSSASIAIANCLLIAKPSPLPCSLDVPPG